MKKDILVEVYKCPIHRYTFSVPDFKQFVEKEIKGLALNLFCGPTKLNINEVRNDLSLEVEADYHMDAYECITQWKEPTFDTIILDPPYAYRKSMEFYEGRKASSFLKVKDYIPTVLKNKGRVITFGYHSHSMGVNRNFEVEKIGLFSHGGAIHDTIATVEILYKDRTLF